MCVQVIFQANLLFRAILKMKPCLPSTLGVPCIVYKHLIAFLSNALKHTHVFESIVIVALEIIVKFSFFAFQVEFTVVVVVAVFICFLILLYFNFFLSISFVCFYQTKCQ